MVKWSRAMVERLRDVGVRSIARVPDDVGMKCAILTVPPASKICDEGRAAESPAPESEARVAVVLRVDPGGVRVCLEVPPGLAPSVRSRAADPLRAADLTAAVRALPEQFFVGVEGHEGRTIAPRVRADALARLVDRAGKARRALRIEWSIPREIAIRHAALLDEELDGAIVALMDVLMILSGVPRAALSPARARRRGRRRAEEGQDRPDRRRGSGSSREEGPAPPADEVHAGVPTRGPLLIRSHAFSAGAARPKTASPDALPDRSGPGDDPARIDRGVRVCVLDGPFSGKVGVVQELDGKGGARVMLGLLAVHMRVADLAVSASSRRRPLLSTSYRKPLPARPVRS
ncbi:MAG TPA: hypothetical protein VKU41_28555 [Polyangiaceae bacterium]|nr:hypothetical protein [Polyangiaceae bacterium]